MSQKKGVDLNHLLNEDPIALGELMQDQLWRLCNLYWIKNKDGDPIPFRPTFFQKFFLKTQWLKNIILKARQMGISTLIEIYILDSMLFEGGIATGIVDITLPDAKKKLKKIKFAYKHIGQIEYGVDTSFTRRIHKSREAVKSNETDFEISNGSTCYASTSFRGGTLQILHVTEYAKIGKKRPGDAKEIKDGALEAISMNNEIFIESTAEDATGDFYDKCENARRLKERGIQPSPLDYKFFFFAWWEDPEYDMDVQGFVIPKTMEDYFRKLEEELEIELTRGQKVWYCKKKEEKGDSMFKEYPSTPDEAFKGSVEGRWYKSIILKLYEQNHIQEFDIDPSIPVDTDWDLGHSDYTSIIFSQQIGLQTRIVDFIEDSQHHIDYYIGLLKKKNYLWGSFYLPHDADNQVLQATKTTYQQVKAHFENVFTVEKLPVIVGINEVRRLLLNCYFRESTTGVLLEHLENYSKRWSASLGEYVDDPLHDEHSHGCDAMRTLGVRHKILKDNDKREVLKGHKLITAGSFDPYD